MMSFIDAEREAYGVEPICRVLPIAPSTYYEVKAREADSSRLPARVARDAQWREQICRVWGGKLPGVRRSQGLAPASPRGFHGRPLHGGAADAGLGLQGHGTGAGG